MRTEEDNHSNLAIPPGEYLEEVITELGMTKDELARRMNRPAPKLSAIFKGDKAITPDTALQLEKVVGVPAHIWSGLETEYRLTLARLQKEKEKDRLTEETRLVTKYCYNELVKLSYVKKRTKPIEKVIELQRYFGVTSLFNIEHLFRYQAAFRCGKKDNDRRSIEAVAAWLRIGELEAQHMDCAPFNKKNLYRLLPTMRRMTKEDPKDFETKLKKALQEAGVVLVISPNFPRTYAHGATFWLGKDKAVLMMTIRGSWADIFWFSLFHEVGHLLLHNRQSVFLEVDDHNPEFQKQEDEADRFASNTLIPQTEYERFIKRGSFYPKDMVRIADKSGIDVGVVVGRLQHDNYLKRSWHNNLRTRYVWHVPS
jgi:HTH-type transcriptional regulator/antitoxin HigA